MRFLPKVQINPTSRIAAVLHTVYLILLPLLVLSLVNAKFTFAALVVVFISKWRMFAVRPRYWLANIRSNLVDITVGFSVVAFMANSHHLRSLLVWAGLYCFWLIALKPRSSNLMVGVQAFIAQGLGLSAVFNNYNHINQAFLILATWLICFGASRHFLVAFEDENNRTMSHIWAVFASEIALILGHWNIMYSGVVSQIALVLASIGYTLGVGYYIYKTKGLHANLRRQLVFLTITIIVMIIVLSNWQSKTF
jgi:hypothetical protein